MTRRRALLLALLAAVVAVAVAVPLELLGGKGPGHSTASGTTTTSVLPRSSSTTSSTTLPVGGPVPAGFVPKSASFLDASTGFVLGVPSSCPRSTCVALARTTDGGAQWVGLPVPHALFTLPFTTAGRTMPSVGHVHFADQEDGWLFDPSLFATHDGGATWQPVTLNGTVISLTTAGGVVVAVVAPCAAGKTCGPLIEQAPITSDAFVTAVSGPAVPTYTVGVDAVHTTVGFVDLGAPTDVGPSDLYATSHIAHPTGWHAFPDPCGSGSYRLRAMAAPDDVTLYTLCVTANGFTGHTLKRLMITRAAISTVTGTPPTIGDGGLMAVTTSGALVLATSSGATWIERSGDGGQTWTTVDTIRGGGAGFTDLSAVIGTVVVVVSLASSNTGSGELGGVLMSTDAGTTWSMLPTP